MEYWIKQFLQAESFSEEQINELKMQKVWDILMQIAAEDFDKVFGLLSKLYERKNKP